jgi:choline kinase
MRRDTKFITSPRELETGERIDDFITIVLLSENYGYRMKSYGPVPLLKIGNKSLIDIQIEEIRSVFSDFEIILCSGFGSLKIAKYIRFRYPNLNVRIVENQLYEYSNSCESLRLCLNNTTNNKVLICSGELIINRDVLSLTTLKKPFIVSEENPNENLEIGIAANELGTVENLCYGIENKWSEILFLHDHETVEAMRNVISDIDYKNRFVFEAINELSKTRRKLSVIKNDCRPLIKLSNIKTYHKIRKANENTNTKLR